MLRLVNSVSFKILQLLPSVFFAQKLDTTVYNEIAKVGHHPWCVYYCSFRDANKSSLLSNFMDYCLDLSKLINVFNLEWGLFFIVILFEVCLWVVLILINYLLN